MANRIMSLFALVICVFETFLFVGSLPFDFALREAESQELLLLRSDLLRQYKPAQHPDRVKLTLSIVFEGCPTLDSRNGKLNSRLFVSYSWRDSRLVWMPDDYSDIRSIRLNPSQIWTPGVRLSAPGKLSEDNNGPEGGDKLTVQSTGAIHWTQVEEANTECDRELTEDGQISWKCPLRFVSWKYAGDEFRLVSPEYQQPVVDPNMCPGMQGETDIEKVGLGSSSFYYYTIQLTARQTR